MLRRARRWNGIWLVMRPYGPSPNCDALGIPAVTPRAFSRFAKSSKRAYAKRECRRSERAWLSLLLAPSCGRSNDRLRPTAATAGGFQALDFIVSLSGHR